MERRQETDRPTPIVVEVLDDQLLQKAGSFERHRYYVRGHHPGLGLLHMGWQGKETIIEKDVIRSVRIFEVLPMQPHLPGLELPKRFQIFTPGEGK